MTKARRAVMWLVAGALVGPGLVRIAAQEMPPMPKPGPEHQIFKEDEGTWDATVEILPQSGMPGNTSKGVETNRIGCNGLCLITDFRGELMPGMVFEGHGIAIYDAKKGKYVGTWTDSMSSGIAISESTWDPATKTMTGFMEGPDATGKVVRTKSTVEYKDGSRVFTTFAPDGTTPSMRITYTRSSKSMQ